MLEHDQKRFLEVVRGATHALKLGPGAIAHESAMRVYQRNYRETHIAALAETYSTVKQVVGDGYFRQLAQQFVLDTDSRSGDLNDYGEAFASFIDASHASQSMPYLSDLARLDWSWFEVLRSPVMPSNWLPELLLLAPPMWSGTTVQAAGRCIHSRHPIYSIWQLVQDGGDIVSLDQGGQTVLVSRSAQVEVTLLAPASACFVRCWLGGGTLEAALDGALGLNPDMDIPALLNELASLGAVESLESKT